MTYGFNRIRLAFAACAVAGLALPGIAFSDPGSAAGAGGTVPSAPAAAPRVYPAVTHVAWVVPDLDQALSQSARQLGTGPADVVFRRVLTVDKGTYLGRPARFSADFALIELGNTQFEFIQPLTGTSPYSDALKGRKGAVLHHIAFVVPSLDGQITHAHASNADAKVVLDAHLKGMDARYVYMSGVLPDTLVEFIPAR